MREFRIVFTTAVLLCAALYVFLLGREVEPVRPDFGTPRAPDLAAPLRAPLGELELAGRVLDERGRPASNVLVVTRGGEAPHWGFTDEEGGFRFQELPAGELEIVLVGVGRFARTERVTVPSAQPVVLEVGEAIQDLEALPPLERSPFAGVVAHAPVSPLAGRDLRGYEVVLRPDASADPLSGAAPRRATLDAEGRFLADGLVHGRYQLVVLPPWAAGGSWPVLGSAEVLHFGGSAELHVPLVAGELAGTVRDGSGEPVRGAVVRLALEDDPDQLWPPEASDADGRYRLSDLAPGRYRLRVRAGDESAELAVEVAAGVVGEQSLQLAPR